MGERAQGFASISEPTPEQGRSSRDQQGAPGQLRAVGELVWSWLRAGLQPQLLPQQK